MHFSISYLTNATGIGLKRLENLCEPGNAIEKPNTNGNAANVDRQPGLLRTWLWLCMIDTALFTTSHHERDSGGAMTLQERLRNLKLLVLDFDGVLTTNKVWTFADGSEAVECSRADGMGIERVKKLGVRVIVMTSEPDGIVDTRCEKVGLEVYHAVRFPKIEHLQEEIVRLRITPHQVAYVGNDLNDLDCLAAVGVPFVVNDHLLHGFMCDPIAEAHDGACFLRLSRNGGDGAVREVCDMIADAKEYLPYPVHPGNLEHIPYADAKEAALPTDKVVAWDIPPWMQS